MSHPIVNITVKWQTYGWVAQTPDWPSTSLHHAGPLEAARELCGEMFGPNPYTLKFRAKGWYEAHLKEVTA